MTDKKSRRVVIINNIKSDTIDQAIFILKSDGADKFSGNIDASIANEAQEIINNYMRQVERIKAGHSSRAVRAKQKKAAALRATAFTVVSLLCLGISFALLYHFG